MPEPLDQLLASLEKLPGDACQGFFGPASITWRVNRESALFLGAGRAALLQLAHPWVATALAHHSNLLNDAVGRFHSTFRVIYTMLFGDRSSGYPGRRDNSSGVTPDDSGSASQRRTLSRPTTCCRPTLGLCHPGRECSTGLRLCVCPRSRSAEREQYYQESKRMAALFSIPADELPSGLELRLSEIHDDHVRVGRIVRGCQRTRAGGQCALREWEPG